MDADRASSAEHVRDERSRARVQRIPQDERRVIAELVEFATTAEPGRAQAVLCPTAARAEANVLLYPVGGVSGPSPAQLPLRPGAEISCTRQPAEGRRKADFIT